MGDAGRWGSRGGAGSDVMGCGPPPGGEVGFEQDGTGCSALSVLGGVDRFTGRQQVFCESESKDAGLREFRPLPVALS